MRATYFENRQTANGGTPMLNSDGEQIDLLTQELEQADYVDPITATGSISAAVGQDGTTGGAENGTVIRERTSSLARTFPSDGGTSGAEHERLLSPHHAMVNTPNSTKMPNDSPSTSGRNTPTLAGKLKRQIFRAETATPPPLTLADGGSPPPPSLTGGSSSPPPSLTGRNTSKNRSLT